MNSYISSFRALLAALAIIGAIEVGYSVADPSSPVERSGYLNFNFNSKEFFHKILIQEKLVNAIRDQPGVIQIGDSSGFHAIVPRIVDQYLGGLKYENLSCCANTGFDGYYSIVDFMLRHTPSIKAVVLYISLNNTPKSPASVQADTIGGQDRVRNAFGPLAPVMSPATLAARPQLVRSVYTLGQTLDQEGLQPINVSWPELVQFLRATRGWRPEQDVHRVPEKQNPQLKELCGPSGVRLLSGHTPQDYGRDIFGTPRSYTEVELRRLAALTARQHAKLILLIQPYPCPAMDGSLLPSLKSDIAAVMTDFPNLAVPDGALFEPWNGQWFSSPDHLKTGREDAASRRAGRSIAKALAISFVEPPTPAMTKATVPVWSSSDFSSTPWKAEGLVLTPKSDGGGVNAVETATVGRHYLETTIPALLARTYVASITFSTNSQRNVVVQFLPLLSPGDSGNFHCSASALEVSRTMSVLDSAIEERPDHKLRCWGKFKLTRPGAIIHVGLSPALAPAPDQGDGTSGVTFYKFELSAVDDAD
jgi:hypothetical protein